MHETLLIIHILAAATWIGGSLSVTFLNRRLRAISHEAGSGFMASFEKMGRMYFPPAAVVLLVSGILLVVDSDVYAFEDPFVVIGVAIIVAGALLGSMVFGPLAQRAQAAHAENDNAAVDRVYRRFGRFGVLDVALLAFAVVVMVTKLGT
jgi:uncharacterized membrane protein